MSAFVCGFCFQSDTIRESVTIYGGDLKVEVVHDEEGAPAVRSLPVSQQEREVNWNSTDHENFWCSHCLTARTKLADLVIDAPLFQCRACGFSGGDLRQHTCPEKPERIDPERPPPEQEALPV